MNLTFYKPRNPILQKYIKGYYFITDDHTAHEIHICTLFLLLFSTVHFQRADR